SLLFSICLWRSGFLASRVGACARRVAGRRTLRTRGRTRQPGALLAPVTTRRLARVLTALRRTTTLDRATGPCTQQRQRFRPRPERGAGRALFCCAPVVGVP